MAGVLGRGFGCVGWGVAARCQGGDVHPAGRGSRNRVGPRERFSDGPLHCAPRLCYLLPSLSWQLATSAAIFYGYIFVVGLIVWGVVKWFRGELKIVNVFCIYGACRGPRLLSALRVGRAHLVPHAAGVSSAPSCYGNSVLGACVHLRPALPSALPPARP